MVYPYATPYHWTSRGRRLGNGWCGYARGILQPIGGSRYYGRIRRGILGAVIAIALGVTSLSMFYMPAFCLRWGLCIRWDYYFLTWRNNKLDTTTLLLAGVAVSMLLGAFTSGILTMINEYRLREFLFWMVVALISVVGITFTSRGAYHDGQRYFDDARSSLECTRSG